MTAPPRRNVELKAHLPSLDAARLVARELTGGPPCVERQIDTYFHCSTGRLKLREIEGAGAQLLAYERPEKVDAALSRYRLAAIADAAGVKQILAEALGVERVVSKTREIYLYRNVRIHLDEVEGLGPFLEFEVVLDDGMSAAEGEALVEALRKRFDIQPGDLVDVSYGDFEIS